MAPFPFQPLVCSFWMMLPLLGAVAAAERYELRAEKFINNPAATNMKLLDLYDLERVPVSFWTTPNANWDNAPLMDFKALIVRLSPQVIDFTPYMYIADGSRNPLHCRSEEDGGSHPEYCYNHCQNQGRYCESATVADRSGEDHSMVQGHDIVVESARRMCVWELYGQQNPLVYFDYLDALRETGCDKSTHMSDECWTQVYDMAKITTTDDLHQCMFGSAVGPLGQDRDLPNQLLEDLVETSNALRAPYPVVKVQEHTILQDQTLNTVLALEAICDQFKDNEKPPICTFCTEFCPGSTAFNVDQCLWELQCGGEGGHTFDQWVSGSLGVQIGGGPLPAAPVTTSEDEAKFEQEAEAAQQWVAIGYVDQRGEAHAYDGQTLPPQFEHHKQQNDGGDIHDNMNPFMEDLKPEHIIMLIVAVGAALGLLISGVRTLRTRRIIKRYKKEREERERQLYEADFDLETNYRDHVSGRSNGGSSNRNNKNNNNNNSFSNMEEDGNSSFGELPMATHAPPKMSFLPPIS